jgi:hypothetical protein
MLRLFENALRFSDKYAIEDQADSYSYFDHKKVLGFRNYIKIIPDI